VCPRLSLTQPSLSGTEDPRLVQDALASIERAGLQPGDLFMEVTENRPAPDEALGSVRALRDEGVRISLDDFGISHSNLSYLQRFAVDQIKIDRSFIAGLTEDKVDRGIVNAVLALCSSLDLDVVAEGIETRGQWAELLTSGFHLGQGFSSLDRCRRPRPPRSPASGRRRAWRHPRRWSRCCAASRAAVSRRICRQPAAAAPAPALDIRADRKPARSGAPSGARRG
jgi:EAL domain-containing protein (putative c-di-GMP-specific phosphodiesterase class I)